MLLKGLGCIEVAKLIMSDLEIIGWKESVDLPAWGIVNLLAKADTGARSSALDVKAIQELEDGRIQFDIVLDRKDRSKTKTVVADLSHIKRVRSSNGQVHQRYFVTTQVRIGHKLKQVEFSLVCRKSMICRVLLGRKTLEHDFLVDSSKKYKAGPRGKVAEYEI